MLEAVSWIAFGRRAATALLAATLAWSACAEDLPLVDAHLHYSHDAWQGLPPAQAIELLRAAGLKQAFVSSSSDDGTQMLVREAPDLVVPVLRPYRQRGDLSSWFRDASVVPYLAQRLERHRYAGIGEFHVYGDDAASPVLKQVIDLARKHRLFLHAHSDVRAVEKILEQDPEATVLWAHAGFAEPDVVGRMLDRFPRLSADLAFRSDHAPGGELDPVWRELFLRHADRFMVGTDTFTPERWHFVKEHANASRHWLRSLPKEVAEKIAHRNADRLARWALGPAPGPAPGEALRSAQ
jgi:hypothetical protein